MDFTFALVTMRKSGPSRKARISGVVVTAFLPRRSTRTSGSLRLPRPTPSPRSIFAFFPLPE
ncbi:hypothetical protein D3C80_1027990 [compost metagenome]